MTGYESKKAAARDKLEDDDIQIYQRPWVDLTDEEITKTYWSREPFKRPTPIGFAREIEQLLKEKNNG